jgi:hypothetical protein
MFRWVPFRFDSQPSLTARNSSKSVSEVLLAQDTRNDNTVAIKSIVDRMGGINSAPVACADMIDGRVKPGLLGQLVKTLHHAILITQRLIEAEVVYAILKDAFSKSRSAAWESS